MDPLTILQQARADVLQDAYGADLHATYLKLCRIIDYVIKHEPPLEKAELPKFHVALRLPEGL